MYNWRVDEKQFKKKDSQGYKIWRLEQLINFGSSWQNLNMRDVWRYRNRLNINPKRQSILALQLERYFRDKAEPPEE